MNQKEELVENFVFIDNFDTREVNNKEDQDKFIVGIRQQIKKFYDRIDKLQQEFETKYDYIQYKKPLKIIEYGFMDEPKQLIFTTNFTILKDFVEDHSESIVEDLQNDSNLINYFITAIDIGTEIYDYFFKEDFRSTCPVEFSFSGGSSELVFRDDQTLGSSVPEFKDLELKSSSFYFYPYNKEIQCPFCKHWIPFSKYDTATKFGTEVLLHFDENVNKTVYFTSNPLKTAYFEEEETVVLVNYTNFTQEHLNILEAFHMFVNQEPITHFNRVGELKLELLDTEVYFYIKSHKPIGYAYWNKASIEKGEMECARQLYILPKYRKQSYARKLLKHKIDKIEKFITESPNEISSYIMKTYFDEKYVGSIYCP